jgi:hypothetical protein
MLANFLGVLPILTPPLCALAQGILKAGREGLAEFRQLLQIPSFLDSGLDFI